MSLQMSRSGFADFHADINMTPLIDVMLALVVVFMIAAPLLVKQLSLPLGREPSTAAPSEAIHLGIGANGALTWNEQVLQPQLLREELRVLSQRQPQPELRIEVAATASYQSFATVLADAKVANIERISVLDAASR